MTYGHLWVLVIMPSAPNPPPSDRRSRRSAELRERLFRAALDLFAKKGFAETTVEDITNAADVGKGTFFNYFPSKDHILLAFGDMQLAKLQSAVDEARRNHTPMLVFFRSLGQLMTAEPTRNPDIIRAILQAFISSTPVREGMLDLQKRVLALHSEMIQMGQQRGEIRDDLPPIEIAQVFRQTIFGTLLIWSLYADGSLLPRMEAAFEIMWKGMTPRNISSPPLAVPMFW
jgi:AcrR family transcriptional regulator